MQLPNGWKEVKLGECFDIQLGKMLNESARKQEPQFPYIANVNVRWGALDLSTLSSMFFSEREKEKFALKKNDILMCEGGEIGRCVVLKEDVQDVYYQKACHRLRAKNNLCDPWYLYFYMSYIVKSAKIIGLVGESSIAHLPVEKVEKILLTLPPLAEQKKIAETLSVWDSAIEKMEKLIESKQLCFYNLLNELIYCPAKEGVWQIAKLGDISEMCSGGTPKSSVDEYYNGDILWVSIADMTEQGMYIFDTAKKLTQAGIENSSAKVYPAGTVLYAMYASIGEVSIASVEMSSSQAILGIQVGETLRNKYLYYFLVGQKDRIKLQGQSGTQSNLNAGMVRNFDIPLPSLKKQDEIVELLDSSQKELSLLKQQLALYKKQKQGLMQKLLTGEWRVK